MAGEIEPQDFTLLNQKIFLLQFGNLGERRLRFFLFGFSESAEEAFLSAPSIGDRGRSRLYGAFQSGQMLRTKRAELNREAKQHRAQLAEIHSELSSIGAVYDVDAAVAEKRTELHSIDEQHSLRLAEWNRLNDDINSLVKQIEQLLPSSLQIKP